VEEYDLGNSGNVNVGTNNNKGKVNSNNFAVDMNTYIKEKGMDKNDFSGMSNDEDGLESIKTKVKTRQNNVNMNNINGVGPNIHSSI
jgi:hypothetical protein